MSVPKTVKQAGILASSKLFAKILASLAVLWFARFVGPDHFGVYYLIMSTIILIYPFQNPGLSFEALRRSKPNSADSFIELFWTVFSLNVLSSFFVGGILIYKGYSVFLAIIASLVFITRNFLDYFGTVHMVLGRVRFISIASILDKLVFSILVILLPKKTSMILLSFVVSQFLAVVYLFKTAKFKVIIKWTTKYFSLAFFLTVLTSIVAERFPAFIYEGKFGLNSLGNFGAAAAVFQAVTLLITEMKTFVVARSGVFGSNQWKRLFRWALVFSGISLGVLFLVKTPIIIVINFVYGEKFTNVGLLFFYTLLHIPAMILTYFFESNLVQKNPKGYAFSYFAFMVASISFALIAPSIEAATLLGALSRYVLVGVGYLVVFFSKSRSF